MNIALSRKPASEVESAALILIEIEGAPPEALKASLPIAYESGEISGKAMEMTLLHRVNGFRAGRVLMAGAGKRERFGTNELRHTVSAAVRHLKSRKIKEATLSLDPGYSTPEHVAAAVEGAILGDFEPEALKTEKSTLLDSFTVNVTGDNPGLDEAAQRGRIVGEAQNFAREIANEPPNQLTPMAMASRARAMAEQFGLSCEVLDQDQMKQLGMGALLGVAQGSAEPPALILLRYMPESGRKTPHLGLLDLRSSHLLPLALGGLLQHVHLDLSHQPFVHIDTEVGKESADLLRTGLHSETCLGVLGRSRWADALSSSFCHRHTGLLPRGRTLLQL